MNNPKLVTEFIGTFFLVVAIAFTGDPLVIGVALAVLVYMGGHISGGHYNPAVTFALLLRKQITAVEARSYMFAQSMGAFFAAVMYWTISDDLFLPHPGRGTSWITAFTVEALFTFLLVYTIISVATDARIKGNQYFGLAIGGALLVGAYAGGSISGGAYNPAVGIMPLLLDFKHLSSHISQVLLYATGPVFGAAAAAWLQVKHK